MLGTCFINALRRWVALLGQAPSLSRNPEIEAYTHLARLRRRRFDEAARQAVLRLPRCIDDPQVNLRISM